MKRTLVRRMLVAACLATAFASASAQPTPIRPAQALAGKGINVWTVVQDFEGKVASAGDYLATFMTEFEKQGLGSGDRSSLEAILVLQGDPDAGDVKMQIGLIMPGPTKVSPPLRVERLHHLRVVRKLHAGKYEELGEVHKAVVAGVIRDRSGGAKRETAYPVVLRLITDPRKVATPADIKTELIVPVRITPSRELTREQTAAVERGVRGAKALTMAIVSQPFEGTLDEVDGFLATFMKEFEAQGFAKDVAIDARPLLLLYSNPDEGSRIKMEIGFPVAAGREAKAPLKLDTLKTSKAVKVGHRGAYGQLSAVYRTVISKTPGGAERWPVVLRLLTDPRVVASEEEILTELIVLRG